MSQEKKEYRIYEAQRNAAGGIEGNGSGWDYISAETAESAAELWWEENSHSDIDENSIIVATDDDGDSYHLSVW